MSDITGNPSSADNDSPVDAPHLAPIDSAKRIAALDIIRGIALIGILLMNIEWFGRSLHSLASFDTSLTGLDHAVGWLVRCFIEGKFYKLFALLFGMGFAVMLMRARESGRPFAAWFTRRMLVLLAFGLLHMIFLWSGDILHDYAFAGLLFLGWILLLRSERLQRFDNPGSFLKLSLTWLSIPFVASAVAALGFGVGFDHTGLTEQWQEEKVIAAMVEARMDAAPEQETESQADPAASEPDDTPSEDIDGSAAAGSAAGEGAETDTPAEEEELSEEEELEQTVAEIVEKKRESEADEKEELEAFTQGSYWQATRYRLRYLGEKIKFTPMFSLIFLLPIFILGYWLISSGVIRNHQQHRQLFRQMAWLGTIFGLFFTIGGLTVTQHPAAEVSTVLRGTGETLFFAGQYVLCAGYLGLIVMLLGSPRWAKLLGGVAPMGQMALTNYIMQSVILTTIFYGYAGGLFGEISRAPQMLIVLVIVVFQIYFSRWWLNRYRFGPLEWLWRSLTYRSLQPMKTVR